MARYKTKPCEIEAIQFTNASIDEVIYRRKSTIMS